MKFGDYIREIRERNGWTQPEAALKAGIEQSYLSKLETGKSWPSEEVFARLGDAYGFAGVDVVARVDSAELAKLKEVGDVRAAVLDRQRTEQRFARGWLIAMLVFLLAGGTCLGLTQLAEGAGRYEFRYVSLGVLRPDEQLSAFAIVQEHYPPEVAALEEARAFQREMNQRLDIETQIATQQMGDWYVETVDGGRRMFELEDVTQQIEPSPLRWFFAPAFAFLIGSLGCAFISLRWK